ncbi:MAG TPA: excisionase family DNA-binding protein [Ferruginibacter sp.]|nr:excisionase family DNA-binding protein [Ferruginibacter sp.]
MEAVLERTTKEDQRIAKSSIDQFRETSTRARGSSIKIKIQESGDFLTIPKKALSLLFHILSNMAQGRSITLIPSDAEVSTQQAADMLNVSRPHLVKLLEDGEIPFKKVGTHRRIELIQLIDYEKKVKENRNEKLNFLAKQAQDLNLGY